MRRRIFMYGVVPLFLLMTGAGLPSGRAQDGSTNEPTAGGAAQSPTAAAPEPSPSETPEPPAAEPEIHPDAVSSFVTRTYKIKPGKLWDGLLRVLTESGYPPEEVDQARLHVKTSFVDFDAKSYPGPVGEAPPEFSPKYPIMQLRMVKEGKLSLEAIIAQVERGSTLSLRARILVHGLNRRERTRVLTDRRSSGLIEKTFFTKLEESLRLKVL